jgi:Zn-dependent peptidase ImmA (M78 family)
MRVGTHFHNILNYLHREALETVRHPGESDKQVMERCGNTIPKEFLVSTKDLQNWKK